MNNTKSTLQYHRWFIISLLMAMGILSQFASDNFLPSLPAISTSLNTTPFLTRMTISIYLAGLFLSQLIYGPLSDRKGRRPIIFFGIFIFGIGTTICLFSTNIYALLIGRFIQGIGIGATSALFRAILRDCFQGIELAKTGAYLGIVFAIIPALAPLTGGYVQSYFGWRYNFALCLLFMVLVTSYLYFYLPETLSVENRQHRNVKTILKLYGEILVNKTFMWNTLCSCFAYSGLMIYITISPFLYQHVIGLTPVQYGWVMPLIAVSFLIGGILNSQLMHRINLISIMQYGGIIQLVAALSMFALGKLGYLNLYVILIPMMCFVFANAFVFANSFAGAFEPFPHIAGLIGALYASLQMLFASGLTSFAAWLPTGSQMSLASLLIALSLGINLLLYLLKKQTG